MKFTCNKNDLINAINIVQKAVPSKSTMPVLEGILLEVKESSLKLSSNDLEIAIECSIDVDAERFGSAVVYSKTFGEIVRKISDDEIFIEMNEFSIINIDSRYSHFELKSIDPEGFPSFIDIVEENKISIEKNKLKDVIRQTVFAVSDDDNRPVFKGVLVEIEENNINFVSTDGYKLALRKENTQENNSNFSCIIPGKTLIEINKIIQSVDNDISISISKNQMLFRSGRCKLVSRLIEGTYLDYRIMIPKEYTLFVKVQTKDILAAIERASIVMGDEKKSPLNFLIENDKIIITVNAENGISKEEVFCETFGNKSEIRFNSRNFIDTLKVIEDDKIKIQFTTDVGPCAITQIDGDKFIYLIMPLKTRV